VTAMDVSLCVNGRWRKLAVEPHETLLEVLRERLGLMGTKYGCGEGECGACTVSLDGQTVLSCLVLAVQADSKEIVTAEGLADGPRLHPLQQAFVDEDAIQCGYCTPGMLMAARELLQRDPAPSEAAVRRALSGNLCRCTGYQKPISAVLLAAERMREGS
jgi:aerobic-type carbon monoxide dehydrogenase small subunit (CoxS/CutS family)